MIRVPLALIPSVESLIDVLDRVIDRGVRVDPLARAVFADMAQIASPHRFVVTRIEQYLTGCERPPIGIAVGHPPAELPPLFLAESLHRGLATRSSPIGSLQKPRELRSRGRAR
jgi:hypothetical protein